MSQSDLADMVGVKFQQIQKYETGTNRVSASRLWQIAIALEVPITYFFSDEAVLREECIADPRGAIISRQS
jgi:transcriptional regulator with XRE-family HTH domain